MPYQPPLASKTEGIPLADQSKSQAKQTVPESKTTIQTGNQPASTQGAINGQ